MAGLLEAPSGNRIRIAFFGLRNAGKSTLVNQFCGQQVAIVSDTPGTTTDPVSKAMEILPLGPCLITDTAGLDDVGELGAERVRKSLEVLARTDIAVWVWGEAADGSSTDSADCHGLFLRECEKRGVRVVEYRRGEEVSELRKRIAELGAAVEVMPGLLDGLVKSGDRVICVCPIDESAPKGRLILPQVQVIRACLDLHVACTVVQVGELRGEVEKRCERLLVITDSQAFREVREIVGSDKVVNLTSFSILFARQKGDLKTFAEGVAAIRSLRDGDTVLIAEGCTHHRQCNDIGSVKIPKALERMSGRKLKFVFASGNDFAVGEAKLIVHCGGCMLTRREVLRRIGVAREAGIPIVNYGMLLAAASGVSNFLI